MDIDIDLPAELVEQIDEAARCRGVDASTWMREVIERFLARHDVASSEARAAES